MHPGRELAVTHRLERLRRLRMLEEQKAWKRETGFDRIEIIVEMREQHFLAGFRLEPLNSKLYNPRWPHIPEEHTLEMRVDVERLRMETVLLQLARPPQCDSSSRRLPTVNTGSEEPAPPRAETQPTERETKFPLQANVDGFLHVSCTSVDQEGTTILLRADIGVNNVETTTTTTAHAAAREKFARPSRKRQEQRMTAWGDEQSRQFDPGG